MNQTLTPAIQGVMVKVRASGLLVSTCTIQQPTGVLGASGVPDGTYEDVPGLVGIACTAPPLSSSDGFSADESKSASDFLLTQPKHVLLDAWYPQIEDGTGLGWIAVIDGVRFDLMGAESDSQKQMTRLRVRKATI